MKRMLWLEGDTFPAILLHRYAHQIVSGMEYLAAKEIVHRALRAKSILMIDRFTVSDQLYGGLIINYTSTWQSKIGNFGLSRCLGSEECYKKRDSFYEPPVEWCWKTLKRWGETCCYSLNCVGRRRRHS